MALRGTSLLFGRACLLVLLVAAPQALWAQTRTMPVPSVVIYPNTVIQSNMLADRPVIAPAAVGAAYFVDDRAALIGKVTRRTLLPNVAIPSNAITEPHVIVNGAQVKIIFSEGGVTISTYGSAMQAGAIGDLVRVRNSDSGIIVTGVVEADGTVRVGDT